MWLSDGGRWINYYIEAHQLVSLKLLGALETVLLITSTAIHQIQVLLTPILVCPETGMQLTNVK